jgi:biotin carboxylase
VKPRRLLVLGAGPAQLGVLEAAKKRGLHVVAVDRDPAAPGFRYADQRALIPAFEDEEAIERLAAAEHIEGVIAPGIDHPVAVAARIAERLALPHSLSPATARTATSKLHQRRLFAETRVPQPRFEVCTSVEEAEKAALRLGFPCVVKPPDRQGQRGLGVGQNLHELRAAFEHALAEARGGVVLVEELVPGREVTVNAFSVRGRFQQLTVTDRVRADPPAFGVALAHVWPSDLPATELAAVVDVAHAAVDALGIRDGPTYTQVLVDGDGPQVGEVAARVGGGHDAELCAAALGIDLNGLAIAAALGEPVADEALRPDIRAGAACVGFLVPPPGMLESVEGVEAAAAGEGIAWVRVYREPGFTFGAFTRGSDRAGAVLAVGERRETALARAEAALARIRLVTTPAPGE